MGIRIKRFLRNAGTGFLVTTAALISLQVQAAESPRYVFEKETPLSYSFSIEGDISFNIEGAPEQIFKVKTDGRLLIEAIEKTITNYTIRVSPRETFLSLNGNVMEDNRGEKSAASLFISSSLITFAHNGKVLSSEEIGPGILKISQIIRLLPAFPEDLKPASNWQQTVPSISLPGTPVCNLEFNYLYQKGDNDISRIELLSGKMINEEQREGDTLMKFTGRNASKGEFLFDEKAGILKSFEGNLDVILKVFFTSAADKEKKTSAIAMPLNLKIDLRVTLKKV